MILFSLFPFESPIIALNKDFQRRPQDAALQRRVEDILAAGLRSSLPRSHRAPLPPVQLPGISKSGTFLSCFQFLMDLTMHRGSNELQ